MLLQFRVKNYKSIKDEITLDMTAVTGLAEHKHFLKDANGVKVLPVTALFGNNAGGKTNILNAILDMRHNIISSAGLDGVNSTLRGVPFLFDEKSKSQPIEFELFLASNEFEYQYGFSFNEMSIDEEWLLRRRLSSQSKTKWKTLLYREKSDISYSRNREFSKLKEYDELIKSNMLALSFLGTKDINGVKDFNNVYDEVNGILDNKPFDERSETMKYITARLYKNDTLRKSCIRFIKEFDPSFEDIAIDEDISPEGTKSYTMKTVHGGKSYPIAIESSGTKKMITLILIIKLKLENGGALIVDELDSQLHPLIFKKIVRMFHDEKMNSNNAQLIFSSHNLIILNKDDLRRDEIWFVEKSKTGQTTVESLAEIKLDDKRVRSDLDYSKHYLAGHFGAVPYECNYVGES